MNTTRREPTMDANRLEKILAAAVSILTAAAAAGVVAYFAYQGLARLADALRPIAGA